MTTATKPALKKTRIGHQITWTGRTVQVEVSRVDAATAKALGRAPWEVKTWLRRDGRTVLLDRHGFAAGCDRDDVKQAVQDHLDVAREWEREAARGV
jgi:hypothetical protein